MLANELKSTLKAYIEWSKSTYFDTLVVLWSLLKVLVKLAVASKAAEMSHASVFDTFLHSKCKFS